MVTEDGPTAREAIWRAATTLFLGRGYGLTSVRAIARDAGVDPALVLHYFGSKEALFLETMAAALKDRLVFSEPVERLGEHFIRHLLNSDAEHRSILLALVRASDADGIQGRLREVHEHTFVAPLRERLTGPDVEIRTRLAGALVGGLLYALWVVGDEKLAAIDHEEITVRYGALLQQLLDPGV